MNTSFIFSLIDSNVPPDHMSIDIVGIYVSLPGKRITVFSVYCPPHAPPSKFSFVESVIFSAAGCTDGIICMGDFNIDMLDAKNSGVSHINDLMSHFLVESDC